ncbi:MAG TPA: hypothetical protein EYP65_01780, partial [Armatimonadetes bacterium]|nr:hypothetical protein [Armatimonadota bacterium]
YQLEVRKGAPDGPVAFKGKAYTKADGPNSFNGADYTKVEIDPKFITQDDLRRGFLDLYVTVHVKGDAWTIYRDTDDRGFRDMAAWALSLTPEARRRLALVERMRKRALLILPQPRELTVKGEDFRITERTMVLLDKGATDEDRFTASLLIDEIATFSGARLEVSTLRGEAEGAIVLGVVGRDPDFDKMVERAGIEVDEKLGDQGYVLDVSSRVAVATARSSTGLFYAVQTLCQLLDKTPSGEVVVKGVRIRDWPALDLRMVQYDVARGQLIRPEYVKRMIRWLSRAKVNMLMFYLEDDFRYRKYPFLGREGTFTPEVAKELSEYARKFHIQLIPQQEALGHMSRMLGHRELEELREAGDPWVICPLHPKTLPFLRDLFSDLAESFVNADFIHVGGDEFIWAFAKCPRCKEKAKEIGVRGLYALHMRNLHEILRRLGKRMMFWTHLPPSEKELTLQTAREGMLPQDAIPFLWHYGRADFPKLIRLYKEAGFQALFVAPGVSNWSRPYPDFKNAFWNIRNYIVAGAREGCLGECTCTWELMFGSVFETCWYALIYSAECAWSPEWTEKRFFDRKFVKFWFGLDDPSVSEFLFNPWGEAATGFWADSTRVRKAFCSPLRRFCREFLRREGRRIEGAEGMLRACDEALRRADHLRGVVPRNGLTLKLLRIPILIYRIVALRALRCEEASRLYNEAHRIQRADPRGASSLVRRAAEALESLAPEYERLINEFKFAMERCGASPWDLDRFKGLLEDCRKMAGELRGLAGGLERGGRLPEPVKVGLEDWLYRRVGGWSPEAVSTEFKVLKFEATRFVKSPGVYFVDWDYERGPHGLAIAETWVEADGKVLARDEHKGWSGGAKRGTLYILRVESIPRGVKVYICGRVKAEGGRKSYGSVWLAGPR